MAAKTTILRVLRIIPSLRAGAIRSGTLVVAALTGGCLVGGGLEPITPDEPTLLLLAPVDVESFCNRVGVVELDVRARALDCDEDICTLTDPPVELLGDRFFCPAIDRIEMMGVDVTEPGDYVAELVVIETTGDSATRCLLDRSEGVVTVDEEDLEDMRIRNLEVDDDPCDRVRL